MQDHQNPVRIAPERITWNKGKLFGAKPPLRPKHVWSIRTKLQIQGRTRDLAMFNLAIDSKLRGCDVVALKVEDIAPHGYAVDRAIVRQKKTGLPVRFEVTEHTRQAVDNYIRAAGRKAGDFLFGSRCGRGGGITTRQYARLVAGWVASIGLDPSRFGTHSLRRTKATLIYRRTGNLRAVQLLLGHTKIESTARYLGIEVMMRSRWPNGLTCDLLGRADTSARHICCRLSALPSFADILMHGSEPPLRVRCGGAGRVRRPSASTSIAGLLPRCHEPLLGGQKRRG
jgi:integrase